MMRCTGLVLAFGVFGLPGVAAAGSGEDVGFRGCGSHAEVSGWLARQFGETPYLRGLQGDGRTVEIYAARSGTSWTIVVTDPGGQSCIASEGTQLELLRAPPAGPPVA
jgi:hypothetical protein